MTSASGGERGTTEGTTDRELLDAHVAGDPDAFTTLFRRHRDRLWAVALRTLGDPEQAADALQEAMISAVRAAERFRGDARVTTWLHRIVVNACIDQARRSAVRAADPLPDDASELDRMPALADPSHRDDTADRVAERAEVRRALATLPADQRAALVLVDMEGYSVAEAAEILDCAPGTVKSRCARGRARLAPLLRAVWNPDAESAVSSEPGRPSPAHGSTEQPDGGSRTGGSPRRNPHDSATGRGGEQA
jgi:RNA polymerase sigma-70 factor, ECF subfamily